MCCWNIWESLLRDFEMQGFWKIINGMVLPEDTFIYFNFIEVEGNGNPLQFSCLENPVDRGAWCAI